MKTWIIIFNGGSTRTIKADTHAEAKRRVLSGLGAHKLPPISSIRLAENHAKRREAAIAAWEAAYERGSSL